MPEKRVNPSKAKKNTCTRIKRVYNETHRNKQIKGKKMSTANNYIGGRFTSDPASEFYADGVSAEVYNDDGEFTFFEFYDGSKCKINQDGEIFSV